MLAAGFIGQFGKRLADFLLARARRRRARAAEAQRPSSVDVEPAEPPVQPSGRADKTALKIAKKAAKAEVKRRKGADDR